VSGLTRKFGGRIGKFEGAIGSLAGEMEAAMILSKVKRKSQTFHDPELVEYSEQLKDYSERKADAGSRRRHLNILLKVAHLTETAMELLWLIEKTWIIEPLL
jgi:hypothetical protein